MLNTIILLMIFIALILHRHLTAFWEEGRLPYSMGFLLFANILVILYLINFIWMFGIIIGIIISVLTFFQLVYATLLWPFSVPWLIGIYKKNDIPRVNLLIYGTWSFIVLGIGILTVLNFFISDYMLLWNNMMTILNESYFSLLIIVIGIVAISNIIRTLVVQRFIARTDL